MKIVVVIIFCVIGLVLLVRLVRSRIAPNYPVTARDLPEVFSQLDRSNKDGNFAVLMFDPPGAADGEAVNLQYSIERGVVGMDWVLLGPRNIADRDKIIEFASKLGHRLDAQEMNGVRYLRVTGSGIVELGAKIVQDYYHLAPDTKLEMITEGFQWQPSAVTVA
jgi:hypothetical protein